MHPTLAKYFSLKKETVEKALKSYFGQACVSEKLNEAMKYSVFSDGKRFRPILAIAVCEAAGGKEESVIPYACTLELIHTYSLIHDDLPAMDNDDLRRGRPTNHKVYGEASAILAGDGLLTMAFEVASCQETFLEPKTQVKIINLLAMASGMNGMVGGQALDMENTNRKIEKKLLEKIHLHKTGKLIQCATQVGALAAGSNEKQYASICNYGENIGLAFQITDDILDFTGKISGKTPKGDIKNNKSTFATILGIEKSRSILGETIDKAVSSLKIFGEKGQVLEYIAKYIQERIE